MMAKKNLWVFAGAVFALMLSVGAVGWCIPGSPAPTYVSSSNGIAWNNTNATANDQINPSGSHGAVSNNYIILKSSNDLEIFPRQSTSPYYGSPSTWFQDNQVLGFTGYEPTGASSNPQTVANTSRVYYDPNGPSTCGNAGGRWLLISQGKNSTTNAHGILIAATNAPDSGSGGYPTTTTNWSNQAFIACSSSTGCTDNLQLGWDAHQIVVTVNDWSSSTTPAVISFSHDNFECGNLNGVMATSSYAITTGNAAYLTGACPAIGYQGQEQASGTGQDAFNDNYLYLINDYSGGTARVGISSVYNSGNGSWSAVGNYAPSAAWHDTPAAATGVSQNADSGITSPPVVELNPTDLRFTSCVHRNSAIWAAQTVGTATSGTTIAQWFEVGVDTPLSGGTIYAQGLIGANKYNYGCTSTTCSPPTTDNVVNPSIAVNTNCISYSGFPGSYTTDTPTCDVTVGYTDVPPKVSGGTTYLSSAYVLNSNSELYTDTPYIYTDGAGVGTYANCGTGSTVTKEPTGPYTATTLDPNGNSQCSASGTPYTCCTGSGTGTCNYPNDTNFFSVANGATHTAGTCGSNGAYEWTVTFAGMTN